MEAITDSVVLNLQKMVDTAETSGVYTQHDALALTRYLATAAVTSQLLTAAQQSSANLRADNDDSSVPLSSAAGFAVDPQQFTTDGIKIRNAAVVALLYEIGLPYQCTADGRRFRTQLALSRHLDALFRQNQVSKQSVLAVTEERGWYVADRVWTGEEKAAVVPDAADSTAAAASSSSQQEQQQQQAMTAPADETRDRCVVCGIHFKMLFDHDEGLYKYSNCREITVFNDDAAATESDPQLVHGTCWRGLGEPEVLTADQTLPEMLVHAE